MPTRCRPCSALRAHGGIRGPARIPAGMGTRPGVVAGDERFLLSPVQSWGLGTAGTAQPWAARPSEHAGMRDVGAPLHPRFVGVFATPFSSCPKQLRPHLLCPITSSCRSPSAACASSPHKHRAQVPSLTQEGTILPPYTGSEAPRRPLSPGNPSSGGSDTAGGCQLPPPVPSTLSPPAQPHAWGRRVQGRGQHGSASILRSAGGCDSCRQPTQSPGRVSRSSPASV